MSRQTSWTGPSECVVLRNEGHQSAGLIARLVLYVAGTALFAIFILLSPLHPQARKGNYRLEGKLMDPSDSAVPGAQLLLRGPAGEQVRETGADGSFQFLSLSSPQRCIKHGWKTVLRREHR
jgi:hypothetical protein